MVAGKLIRIFFILLVGATAAYIFLFVPNNIEAVCGLAGALVAFWIFHLITRRIKKRRKNKFVNNNNKYKAEILAQKFVNKTTMIIQLRVADPDGFYITNYREHNPSDSQKSRFIVGHNVSVFVNPEDKHDIQIPESKGRSGSSSRRSRRVNGWVIFWVVVSFGPAGIPLFISLFDTSDRVFQDMEYVSTADGNGYIWEVRYKEPRKIFIRIYDPANNIQIKRFKETKTEDLSYYANLTIAQQGHKVVIFTKGATPVMDIYDATTFLKMSDINQFKERDKKLKVGIADINIRSANHEFGEYDVLDITTNDGNKLYYNITTDKFYHKTETINNDLYQRDIEVMKDNLVAFVLGQVEGNSYQKHLYTITAKSNKYIDWLLKKTGDYSYYPSNFERDKRYYCKGCNMTQLTTEPLLESDMLYFDTEIAVIGSVLSLEQNADEKITCYNKEGKVVFNIPEKEYPNYEDIEDDNFRPRNSRELKFTKVGDKLIILFKTYGALCYELSSGKQLWKWEH